MAFVSHKPNSLTCAKFWWGVSRKVKCAPREMLSLSARSSCLSWQDKGGETGFKGGKGGGVETFRCQVQNVRRPRNAWLPLMTMPQSSQGRWVGHIWNNSAQIVSDWCQFSLQSTPVLSPPLPRSSLKLNFPIHSYEAGLGWYRAHNSDVHRKVFKCLSMQAGCMFHKLLKTKILLSLFVKCITLSKKLVNSSNEYNNWNRETAYFAVHWPIWHTLVLY